MKWLVAHLFQLELRLPELLWYQATQSCNNQFNWFTRSVLNILNQIFVRRAKDKCVRVKLLDRLLPSLKACRLRPSCSRTPITKFSLNCCLLISTSPVNQLISSFSSIFVISLIECPPTEECTILNISDLFLTRANKIRRW